MAAIRRTGGDSAVEQAAMPGNDARPNTLIQSAAGLLIADQAAPPTAAPTLPRPRRDSRSPVELPHNAPLAQPDSAGQTERASEQGADPLAYPSLAAESGRTITLVDFDEVFSRFQTPLINYVFHLVGNREQAADLTQDAFVKAYRAFANGTVLQAGALSTWLYRIAHNTATDALRRRRLISWVPLSHFDDGYGFGTYETRITETTAHMSPDGVIGSNPTVRKAQFSSEDSGGNFEQRIADRELVERVLKRLPPKYAHCLLLYEYQGLSCAEVAEILNISQSAVKMRLMRARERFIQLYSEETNGDDIYLQQPAVSGRLARAESRRPGKQRDQQSGSIPIRKGPNVDKVINIRSTATRTTTDRVGVTRQALQRLRTNNDSVIDGEKSSSRPTGNRSTAPRGGKLKKPATPVLSAAQ